MFESAFLCPLGRTSPFISATSVPPQRVKLKKIMQGINQERVSIYYHCQVIKKESIDLYSPRQFPPLPSLIRFIRKNLNISLGSTVLPNFFSISNIRSNIFLPNHRLKQAVIGAVSYHLGGELRPLQPKGGFMSNLSLYGITEEKRPSRPSWKWMRDEVMEDHEALITQVEQMIALKTDRGGWLLQLPHR